MAKKNDFKCPECGSAIKAWAEMGATLYMGVSTTGQPKGVEIKNTGQVGGRFGVQCTKCHWDLHCYDMDDGNPLLEVANVALAKQEAIIFLTAKRRKSE